jgi:hypothetical protein
MGTTPAATTPRPAYRLFNANAVAIAAFLCSPLGGAVLIAVNFVRLGKPRKGAFAVLAGLIATLPAVLINWNGPTPVGSVASVALALLLFFCTWQIAHEIQGDTVQEHLEAGGQLATNFTAFLTGIATLATVVALSYAVFFALQPRKVVVGTNEILYSGLTTRSTAIALGNQLKNDPSFLHRGTTVLIDREVGSRTLSFVVQDGAWDQAGILSSFEEFARKAAPTLGGLPIDIQLLDTKRSLPSAKLASIPTIASPTREPPPRTKPTRSATNWNPPPSFAVSQPTSSSSGTMAKEPRSPSFSPTRPGTTPAPSPISKPSRATPLQR